MTPKTYKVFVHNVAAIKLYSLNILLSNNLFYFHVKKQKTNKKTKRNYSVIPMSFLSSGIKRKRKKKLGIEGWGIKDAKYNFICNYILIISN